MNHPADPLGGLPRPRPVGRREGGVSAGDSPRLVRLVTHALRHAPAAYGLTLDPRGWADAERLAHALARRRPWRRLAVQDLNEWVTLRQRDRLEWRGGRVRARYGHSVPGVVAGLPRTPPAVLYHGTPLRLAPRILAEGLRPQGRTAVHLTSDRRYALSAPPAGVAVALLAVTPCAGRVYRRAGAHVWLTGYAPPDATRLVGVWGAARA